MAVPFKPVKSNFPEATNGPINVTVQVGGGGSAPYVLPPATNTTLGGVIVPDGGGLTVDSNGTLIIPEGTYVKNLSQYGNLTVTDSVSIPGGIQSELGYQATGVRVVDYALSNAIRNDSVVPKTANSSSAYATSLATSAGGTSLTRLDYETYPNNGTYTQILLTDTDAKLSLNRVGTATVLTKAWTSDSILTQGYADTRYLQNTSLGYIPNANLTGSGWNGKTFVGGVMGDPTANLVSGVTNDRGTKQFLTGCLNGTTFGYFWADKDVTQLVSGTGATLSRVSIAASTGTITV